MKLKKKMGGFVQTAELVLLSTVLVTGLTVGLVNVRDAVTTELEDVAQSIGSIDQSYSFQGVESNSGSSSTIYNYVAGSAWVDAPDDFPSGDLDVINFTTVNPAPAGTEAGS